MSDITIYVNKQKVIVTCAENGFAMLTGEQIKYYAGLANDQYDVFWLDRSYGVKLEDKQVYKIHDAESFNAIVRNVRFG